MLSSSLATVQENRTNQTKLVSRMPADPMVVVVEEEVEVMSSQTECRVATVQRQPEIAEKYAELRNRPQR